MYISNISSNTCSLLTADYVTKQHAEINFVSRFRYVCVYRTRVHCISFHLLVYETLEQPWSFEHFITI